jgi:hypothetical protein
MIGLPSSLGISRSSRGRIDSYSKFMPYIEQIEFEIKLLKGWRKANKKIEDLLDERKAKQDGRKQESI